LCGAGVRKWHRSLRKIIKTRGSFPNDDAALKLLYLAIKNAGLRWRRGVEWTAAPLNEPSQRGLASDLIFGEDQDCHIADRSPACGPP